MKPTKIAILFVLLTCFSINSASAGICFEGVCPRLVGPSRVTTIQSIEYLEKLDVTYVPLMKLLRYEIFSLRKEFTACDNEQRKRVRKIFALNDKLVEELKVLPVVGEKELRGLKSILYDANQDLENRMVRFKQLLEERTGEDTLQGIIKMCDQYQQMQSAPSSIQPRN
ncbi:hypothetical protein HN958_02020 [Candidatus Falkowbacteria bacterium]|nr:hypothetical protein [Candidatus Falkowbacteria bacterium]MBT7007261.1 hypothetical protein [Candidatus Falkowbacteria bacterium]